ncbi:MAG: DUF86 domain-containing protein [Flavobacteriales bacterium]|nr:DUF86 domain-containing protein [Flavobacteriales bacterium]
MQHKVRSYLHDIMEAIVSIEEYVGEQRNFNDYLKNKQLRRAVERELEIIGEATNRILKLEKEFPIDNAKRIVSLRNWVIHGYDKVDDGLIWGIVTNDLPKLKAQTQKLMSENDQNN